MRRLVVLLVVAITSVAAFLKQASFVVRQLQHGRHGSALSLHGPVSVSGFTRLRAQKSSLESPLEGYGAGVFTGAVAEKYLEKAGLPKDTISKGEWTNDLAVSDKVAAAVLEWAKDNGASAYCHWFQPMGSSGVRHGNAACVQNKMIEFAKDGTPRWAFDGKMLLRGETDGSSYPNGGLRATHRAGAYLAVDPSSPIFLRGDTIFIPSCMVSFEGYALDEKTPLLRAGDAMSREGVRLLDHLGYKGVKSLQANIGLEQEIFLVPREAYGKRPDLQMTGRTVLGRMPPRGQEMSDHYMSPLSSTTPALACMQEIQEQCFRIGIPLRTRHREVAPNQYEFAPMYGSVTTQIDQNLMVMQIIEEVAASYGLAALLQEKPFQGINGSGKHNNWSIGTDDGTNLLNVGQLAAKAGPDVFPVIMAAIVKAVNENGDLMRLAIATPGNDFRLGACEAPPAIISMYLGDDMTNYLKSYMSGQAAEYKPATKVISPAKGVAKVEIPAQDRNRSSPFPYGGNRFEFRAVGSSQNVGLVNTVLMAIVAQAFKEFSDEIEMGKSAKEVAQNALKDSFKVIFNGNGYDAANQQMLTDMGLWRIDSGVDAIARFTEPKNVKLFGDLGIFTPEECKARKTVMLNHYVGMVEMEALSMIDMLQQHIIPSVNVSKVAGEKELTTFVATLKSELHAMHEEKDEVLRATKARNLRLETMIRIRTFVDEVEGTVPAKNWTLATYKDLLFLDQEVDNY